ncbi:hypothetical protein DM860_016207 [Cuscuta australis]|uniref:Uncharacterized protein n=1 Tax=Cuscuta australis TaxID=267555 RepID=A0A328DRH3_9ASTE|nr:hypothetical protein DM860_016207 [Cuscuta australis]
MNPTAAGSSQPPPPRSSFSCDRHPGEKLSGFCSDCLCERLTTLDQSSSSNNLTTSSSSVTGAIKSLFTKPSSSSSSSYLRRTKSLSASKNDPFSSSAATGFEPQRRSSDVRSRNTIISLDEQIHLNGSQNRHSKGIADTVASKPVLEFIEAEESDDPDNNQYLTLHTSAADIIEEVTDLQEPHVGRPVKGAVNLEIVGKNRVKGNISKPMKDHIDLDSQMEKSSSRLAGGILSTAVLSKKWQKWRKKQKMKKKQDTAESSSLSVETPPVSMMKHIEIQPETAEYGLGRRSCDSDPRFSLDFARISFDGPRYSLDEPRASLDGHLIGRTFPRTAPMVSVVEDAPGVAVPQSDTQIPAVDSAVMMKSASDDAILPGGSTQTRDYYLDSSTRRRKSLDRSNSIRKTAAAVVAEIDEMKAASSAKALLKSDSVNRAKTLAFDKDSASYSNSLRDDCSETLELTSLKDSAERKGMKKSKKWAWNIFGFLYRRGGGSKDEDDDGRCKRAEVSFSKDPAGRDARGVLNRKLYRSSSSVSWRNSSTGLGSFEPARKSSAEMNGHGKERRNENVVLGRNLSGCYFSNRIDNGLPVFT